ncbi:MAG: ATP-binding protein [Bacteroidetes bacterium]|nr:ATP-binding protein [Bacteroidota bacterium]MBU1680667.1 ATP-binding protein [Bacteroidota bacterium]
MFKRKHFNTLYSRVNEKRKFIQVIGGPRQCGKTTLVRQLASEIEIKAHFASADSPILLDTSWIEQQWETARVAAKKNSEGAIIILDEIQKINGWQEVIKKLWDEDTASGLNLKAIILGSSPLLIQRGLTESLAGRFELIPLSHWNFSEMRDAFGWNLNQYIYFGGYPGTSELITDEERWSRYIQDSLVETSVSRDILLLTRIDKPALLRQLFRLGINYSGQIVSYQKLVGQLQDAGNTTTLAHYLKLLSGAGMLTGLEKYSGSQVRRRASSPKFLALNNALITAQSELTFDQSLLSKDYWGRLVESAIGAYLFNESYGTKYSLMYWREGAKEVDYILQIGSKNIAIEVKSGKARDSLRGFDSFNRKYNPYKKLLVGEGGIEIEDFLLTPISEWFR